MTTTVTITKYGYPMREDWTWTSFPTQQTGVGLELHHHEGHVAFNVLLPDGNKRRVLVFADYQMREDNYSLWACRPTVEIVWEGVTMQRLKLDQGQSSWQSMRIYIMKEVIRFCQENF